MSTRHIIGVVAGLAGAVITLSHLLLMLFTNLSRENHGNEFWVMLGFILAIVGIFLLSAEERR